ncbi:MAG: hypothetical protein M3347_04395, partial [Armatimonadota bacterium]|nr:hypothetical protein [Armatimonadota bacterium]
MKPFFARAILALLIATLLPGRPERALAAPPVSAEKYRARLQRVEAQLRRMVDAPQRPLAPILEGLATTDTVQRADGATQTISGDEWQRRADRIGPNANRQQVQAALVAIERRRRALEAWMAPRNGQYYEPADAQAIMRQLESTGQIRTGPTRVQQIWADIKNAVSDFVRRVFNWIAGLFSSTRVPVKPRPIDTTWLW